MKSFSFNVYSDTDLFCILLFNVIGATPMLILILTHNINTAQTHFYYQENYGSVSVKTLTGAFLKNISSTISQVVLPP